MIWFFLFKKCLKNEKKNIIKCLRKDFEKIEMKYFLLEIIIKMIMNSLREVE
jgi:hypothetical protein